MGRTITAALTLLLSSAAAFAQAPMVDLSAPPASPIAIVGARLLTITHGTIENGTIILAAGKITAVGPSASIKVPAGATRVDGTGMTVYPGLIDSETNLGLVEVESDRVNSDLVETSEEIFPQMMVADAFHAESERIPIARFNGVTNAIVAPESGDTIPGQDALIQLGGRDRDQMILNPAVALAMNFGDGPKRGGRGEAGGAGSGRFPSTRMGEISQMRQAFLDAQEYMARRADAKKNPKAAEDSAAGEAGSRRGSPSAKFELRNEALIPYLKGEKPVVLGVYEGYDLETAMKLAAEFHLKVVLNHVTRTQGVLDKLASYHVPVIVGPIYELPAANQRYDAVYSLPAELAKRGVTLAFASYGVEFNRNLPYAAGYAVAYGLPYDEAMKAITINPAKIWGVDDKLGSLDVGKTANVVMANGDPLDVRTSVKQVYIEGIALPMVTRQTRLRDEYSPKK